MPQKLLFCFFATLYLATGAFPQSSPGKTPISSPLIVAAAADLVLAFREIEPLYEASSGIEVQLIFSSSGTAREQIEHGAPYDVYASANIAYVDYLIEKDCIIPDSKELYAIGRIGVATLIEGRFRVEGASDLLKPEIKKLAIADPSHAPYGSAAKEAMERLGLWDGIESKLIYAKDIQHCLTLLRSGNVEAAFISLSVFDHREMRFFLLDDSLHSPLKQAIAVVKRTKNEGAAREFIRFVNGPQGRAIMKKYGFVLPGEIE
jgi:molybdate transport system substrate-binding protein